MPGILNYTTTVSTDSTLAEIQKILTRAGARRVMVDYDEKQQPTAIMFLINTAWDERAFNLPANINAVYAVLCKQASAGKIQRRFATKEQAARVGWRIVKDWLAAQMAIIQAEVVSFEQVMLPYMVVQDNMTLFQLMADHQLLLPGPAST